MSYWQGSYMSCTEFLKREETFQIERWVVCFTSSCQTRRLNFGYTYKTLFCASALSLDLSDHFFLPLLYDHENTPTMSAFRALRQLTSVSSRVVARPVLRSGSTLRLSAQAAPRMALSATRAFSMTSCRFSEGACTSL